MIVIAGALFGVIWGTLLARRRGGKLADIVQYAFVYALAFTLLGLVATLLIDNLV